jgi:hypothetical protein
MADASVSQEPVAVCTIHKQTYSEGRAYRYHISDEAGSLLYVAERTGLLLPSRTRLVEFFDPEHNLVGRLQPPDVAPWLRGTRYEVFIGEEAEEPYAVIWERWTLVDIILLRLPHYEVQLGQDRYVARGSRYGAHFYQIFRLLVNEETTTEEAIEIESEATEGAEEETEQVEEVEEEETEEEEDETDRKKGAKPKAVKVGEIQRPTVGPSYIVEADAASLRQAVLLLTALVIIIDMEIYS